MYHQTSIERYVLKKVKLLVLIEHFKSFFEPLDPDPKHGGGDFFFSWISGWIYYCDQVPPLPNQSVCSEIVPFCIQRVAPIETSAVPTRPMKEPTPLLSPTPHPVSEPAAPPASSHPPRAEAPQPTAAFNLNGLLNSLPLEMQRGEELYIF